MSVHDLNECMLQFRFFFLLKSQAHNEMIIGIGRMDILLPLIWRIYCGL